MLPFTPDFAQAKPALALQYTPAATHWFPDASTLPYHEIMEHWPTIYKTPATLQDFPSGGLLARQWSDMAVYLLDHVRIAVLPCHLFLYRADWNSTVGWDGGLLPARDHIWHELRKYRRIFDDLLPGERGGAYFANTDFSHTSPDWRNVLNLGIPGLLERIRTAGRRKEADGTLTDDQRAHYDSTEAVLLAVLRLMKRYITAARDCKTPSMQFAADGMEHLTAGAPQNTYEALELMLLYYFLQNHIDGVTCRSCGRLDALLQPFVERDLANGTFTKAEITAFLQYWMYTFSCANITANMPFSLGGVDREGKNSYTELTEWIVDAYTELGEISPKLHILMTPDTPKPLLRKICASIRRGINSFVFMSDATVTKSLLHLGRPLEDARDYVLIGCYEPVTMGKEMACTTAGTINLLKAAEYALYEGFDHVCGEQAGYPTPPAAELNTFEQYYDAVRTQVVHLCETVIDYVNRRETMYPWMVSAPLLSSTFDGCVDAGCAAYFGGIPYNNTSICAYALASIADSVAAVREIVYRQKRLSLAEFAEILKNNWENHELLRREILTVCPKYGNHNAAADEFARDLSTLVLETVNNRPNIRGGVFRTGLFSIDWFLGAGAKSMASPDGRLRGDPVSKNLSATVGMDKNGVTALLQSAASLEHDKCPDGNVLDLMLHRSAVAGEDGLTAMTGLIEAYLNHGGYGLQINVLDSETLRKAQETPAEYATLQVRLCGWNAYFTALSRELQEDLIRRTES